MMPAATTAGGTYFAFPDVCKTPAPSGSVPIPYPNTAQVASSTSTVNTVVIENMDTVVEGSKVPSSSGDESGVAGGVVSGENMGEVQPKLYSSKVFFGGKKAVYLTCMSAHNGSSANMPAGAMVTPSQTKVLVGL